jgi:hypothetical protein
MRGLVAFGFHPMGEAVFWFLFLDWRFYCFFKKIANMKVGSA